MKYPITARYLPKPSKRRSGLAMSPGVRFVVAHDTGNPNSSAAANVKYYENSAQEQSASAHLFVDDHEILECIPAVLGVPEKAWHVLYNTPTDNQLFGFNANDAAIGVEYCYTFLEPTSNLDSPIKLEIVLILQLEADALRELKE